MAFRTQKISQMTPKGSDLEATDLIEVSTIESGSYVTRSITGQELIDAIPAPSVDWGDIGGTLSDQTDLNTALSGKVPTSRTLTINGTTQDLSADRTFTISTGITIGTTAIASGTVGRVLFEGTGNVVQESANLFWDNTNARLGIGTSSPSTTFHLSGSSTASGALGRSSLISSTLVASANNDVLIGLDIAPTFNTGAFTGVSTLGIRLNSEFLVSNGKAFTTSSGSTANTGGFAAGQFFAIGNNTNNGYTALQTFYSGVSYASPLSINALGGNVLIGTTTNAGFRLDVNGTARVSGNVTGLKFVATTNGDSFMVGAFAVLDYGDGCRINYAAGAQKVTIYSNVSGGGMSLHNSGNVSIGSTATEVTSAILNVPSTTKGFLPPRMTTTQKNTIATPATGLMVYDNVLNRPCFYDGITWITL